MYLHTKVIFFNPQSAVWFPRTISRFWGRIWRWGGNEANFQQKINKEKQENHEYRWGGITKIFNKQQIYTGQMTVRDSRKFDEKFGEEKRGQQIYSNLGNLSPSRPSNIHTYHKLRNTLSLMIRFKRRDNTTQVFSHRSYRLCSYENM